MARNKFIRIFTKLAGSFTTGELVAREIALEESSNSLVIKKSDNTILRFGTGGSFTPQPYQASPTVTTLRDALVASGVMSAQVTYTVSGVISGDSPVGVDLALVGANTYNTTSGVGGIFNLTGVPDGSYVLTPTKAGHFITPVNRNVVVSGANITGQNFTIAVSSSSPTTSATKVYVPQINATNRLRSVQKSPRALNTELYAGVTVNVYTPTYHNSRLFLPTQDGRVFVYDDNDVLRTTISPAIGGQIFAVHAVGKKLMLVGSTHIQFGTYDNGSPDVWTPGNKVANVIYPQDSTLFNGEVWITGTYAASPTPHNVVRYNVTTEALVRSNLFAGTNANLLAIQAGDTTIAVQNTTTGTIRIIDPATLATVGTGSVNAGSNPNNIAFSRGKFWVTFGGNLFALTTSGNTPIPPGFAANGCVADADFVYVFNNALRLVVVNADTNTVDGSTISGLSSPAYYIQ